MQSPNLFFFVGRRFVPVARQATEYGLSRCKTLESNRCYGNSNVKVRLYSLLFDIYCMYLFSVPEKKPTDPEL